MFVFYDVHKEFVCMTKSSGYCWYHVGSDADTRTQLIKYELGRSVIGDAGRGEAACVSRSVLGSLRPFSSYKQQSMYDSIASEHGSLMLTNGFVATQIRVTRNPLSAQGRMGGGG